ncbi:MAG: MFS transporter [Gammaproteobacteria bacterium]|nr:MAG: MFS transporter [Gammaproteobacteria bacterium]
MSASSARLSLVFANIGHSFSHLFMLLYPTVVLVLEREFGMSYGELLLLLTAGNVLFGVGALPAGWLGDRWSMSGMMVVFFVGLGVASILTGFMSTPFGIAFGLALIGLFASIYHPVGMAWLVRNAVNRGKILGINGIFGSLGIAAAGLTAGVLTDLISWRAAFIVPGTLSVVTGAALFVYIYGGRIIETKVDIKPAPQPPRNDMVRAFIVLSITMLCVGLIFQSISAVLPKVFAERLPALTAGSALGAGGLVSVVYFVAAGAQLLGGYLADRYSARVVYVLTYTVMMPLLLVGASLSGMPLLLVMTSVVFLNTTAIPVENVLLANYSPAHRRGTAFGAKFVLSLGVSALAVPMAALIYEVTSGFFWVFIVLGGLAFTIVLAALFLPAGGRLTAGAVTRPVSEPLD